MKVILKSDIKGLGKKESSVEVSDGYARNYLIPRGLAVEANTTNLNVMNSRQESEKKKKEREKQKAQDLAEKIKGITVVFKAKAGENGKLFGSITNKDIADKLKSSFNLDIDKKQIHLDDAIKSLGATVADIKLYPEISAKLSVKVEQE